MIEGLVRAGVLVVCAGGGGIPVVEREDGSFAGAEAVIDKDYAGALLATSLHADVFLMLTDVDAVYRDWGTPGATPIHRASPDELAGTAFAAGSMGPKVEAACRFVRANSGFAVIGSLGSAAAMLRGEAGTMIARAGEPRLPGAVPGAGRAAG